MAKQPHSPLVASLGIDIHVHLPFCTVSAVMIMGIPAFTAEARTSARSVFSGESPRGSWTGRWPSPVPRMTKASGEPSNDA